MKHECPKCKKQAADRIRTRMGSTLQVRYTYFHWTEGDFTTCDFTIENEPLNEEELARYADQPKPLHDII